MALKHTVTELIKLGNYRLAHEQLKNRKLSTKRDHLNHLVASQFVGEERDRINQDFLRFFNSYPKDLEGLQEYALFLCRSGNYPQGILQGMKVVERDVKLLPEVLSGLFTEVILHRAYWKNRGSDSVVFMEAIDSLVQIILEHFK